MHTRVNITAEVTVQQTKLNRCPHAGRVKCYQRTLSWKPGLRVPPPTVGPRSTNYLRHSCENVSVENRPSRRSNNTNSDAPPPLQPPNQPLLHFSIVDYSLYCILMCSALLGSYHRVLVGFFLCEFLFCQAQKKKNNNC